MAADRQGHWLQDHLLSAGNADLLLNRGKLRFVPDADQDAALDLELLTSVSRDFFPAGCDMPLRMQRPVEQGGPQTGNDIGAAGVVATVGQFAGIVKEII